MKRQRRPLVSEFVEHLSSAALERYADVVRDVVGRRHGVYALYKGDRLYYVGLASNLKGRLNTHLRDRHKGLWNHFSVYLTIDLGHLRELESLVIRIANPKGNKQRGKFAKSENLLRTLKRRWKQQKDEEWQRLLGGRHAHRARTVVAGRDTTVRRATRGARSRGAPPLATFLAKGRLRGTHKGHTYRASVRSSGKIHFGGVLYNSPSQAATAACGRPMNGWSFWQFQLNPGEWVKLSTLRTSRVRKRTRS